MKKLIYLVLFAFATTLTITSCTEEEVKPTTVMNGGGSAGEVK